MPWNFRRFGTHDDPVHKSHLNELTGDFGCPRRFRYQRDDETRGEREAPVVASGKAACGTAVHEVLARALTTPELVARLLAGPGGVSRSRCELTFDEELAKELRGRDAQWNGDDKEQIRADRVDMIHGLLNTLHERVARIELVEAGFTVEIEGYVLAGHVDLAYRPKFDPRSIALADWKTGANKPASIELDHGWEAGIYSAALRKGTFIARDQVTLEALPDGRWKGTCYEHSFTRATRFQAERDALEAALATVSRGEHGLHYEIKQLDTFPSAIHHVHLGDFVPYRKAGTKEAKRPEDLEFYRLEAPGKVKYVAGDRRGPAWLPVRRGERDIPRLAHRLRTVIGTVRMGRFFDLVGERCSRCAYAQPCLNDGYAARGDELVRIEAKLRAAGL